jgi:hypothetical protein
LEEETVNGEGEEGDEHEAMREEGEEEQGDMSSTVASIVSTFGKA